MWIESVIIENVQGYRGRGDKDFQAKTKMKSSAKFILTGYITCLNIIEWLKVIRKNLSIYCGKNEVQQTIRGHLKAVSVF